MEGGVLLQGKAPAQCDCGNPFLSVQAFHSLYSVHLVSLLNVAPSVKHSQDTLILLE